MALEDSLGSLFGDSWKDRHCTVGYLKTIVEYSVFHVSADLRTAEVIVRHDNQHQLILGLPGHHFSEAIEWQLLW